MVSAIGVVLAIVTDFMAVIRELGGTDEDFYRLSKPEGKAVLRKMAQLVVTAFREKSQAAAQAVKEAVEELGWIELDPAISFDERKRRGNYNYANPNITDRASHLTNKVRRFIVLYDPRGSVSTEEMKRRIRANGDTPASADDAFEVGYTFPERQRKNPILFLDENSVCVGGFGSQCAPVLSEWSDRRGLLLLPLAGDWLVYFRFAAVREEEVLEA